MWGGVSIGTIALLGWLAIAASFALIRRGAAIVIVSLAGVAACGVACGLGPQGNAPSCALAATGLAASGVGFLLVRAMLVRSVSLAMLAAAAGGDPVDVEGAIAGRLDEAALYKLATCDGDRFELTPAGRAIVRCITIADRALGRSR